MRIVVAEHRPDVAVVDIRMPPTHTDEGLRAAHAIREREILALIADGRTNKAIGERLSLSPSAVRKSATSIFTKLGLPAGEDDHRRILAVLAFLRP